MNRGRIERAFERRFRELLGQLGARSREKGVRWLFEHAQARARSAETTLSHALAEENIVLAEKVHRVHPAPDHQPEPLVICDAGLGGLARWLRARGCEARWIQDITDEQLVADAERLNAVIITTDSLLLDRRPIAQGRVRALWVPPTLTRFEQLRLVRAELNLPEMPEGSRCMRCGGELLPVNKAEVKDEIPPRTYRWLDEFFRCKECGQLFWEGTHWQRVQKQLAQTAPR